MSERSEFDVIVSALAPLQFEDLDHVLTHTRGLWEEARGQSFFITGGTGFFGIWLLETFTYINEKLALNMRAVVLSRDPVAFGRKVPHLAARSDLRFATGDMRDFEFPAGRFPFVIHAASDTSVPVSANQEDEIRKRIVDGTRQVLEFAKRSGTRNFLITSSGAAYGPQPASLTHVPEDYPSRPLTPYGKGKYESEALCREAAMRGGLDVKIARCFAFVGPHLPLDGQFAIGNFIRDSLSGSPIRISGDGTPIRSYLYAADLTVWLWTLLFRGPSGRVYNVGSDEDLSILEVAQTVKRVLNSTSIIEIAQTARLGHAISRYVPEVTRAKTEHSLKTNVTLADAVRRTGAWYRGRPTPMNK